MPAQHLKDQLIRLTGSDVVMVNDDKYMAKLRQSIWDEYQKKLDKDEKVREEEERQRLRKLLDRGLVTVVQLRDEYNFHLQNKKGRNSSLSPIRHSRESANSSAGNRKKGRRGKDIHSPSGRGKDSSRQGSRSQTAPGLVCVGRPTYTAPLAERTFTPATLQDKTQKSTDRKDRRDSTPFETSPRVALLEEDEEAVGGDDDDETKGRQSPRLSSAHAWLNKYQDPLVTEMKREETVDGLYNLAARLVPLTKKK